MSDNTVEVNTSQGTVRGLRRGPSSAFYGIPFAEAPVAERRFAAPVRRAAWDGVLDATEHGATPQLERLADVTAIPEPPIAGESILNVNVFTPAPGDRDSALPVLLYFHGGGYVAGSPASPWYDGAAFNRDGVVTVTVSYRLGFDGFGWIEDAPLNRGILDWVMALEWVRDNIREFGGDPGRVTVAGQSAGGGAALTLLAVPRAAGLFHATISLSGATCDMSTEAAERIGRALADLAGVAPTREGLSTLSRDQVLEQQILLCSAARLEGDDQLAALEALYVGSVPFGPVVDGDVLPRPVLESIEDGVSGEKPLLLGATDHEFKQALDIHESELEGVETADILARLGLSDEAASAYAAARSGLTTAGVAGQLVSDCAFRLPALDHARARARAGGSGGTYLYRFAWVSPVSGGATHCLDVPFFFDGLQAEQVEAAAGPHPPQQLADDVHGAAVAFVTNGDPGWPAYDEKSRDVQVYDVPSAVVPDGFNDLDVLTQPSSPASNLALVCALGLGLWPPLA